MIKRLFNLLAEPLFLLFVFFVTQLPLRDPDIWFHMKAGELFVTEGLQFTEKFSHAAAGREWLAFEWLFQIIVYHLSTIGLWIIPPFISLFSTMMMYFFLKILRRIFAAPLWLALVAGFFWLTSIYEFYTARPHILAYSFILLEFYLIYLFIFQKKLWLLILPLVTLFWTNIHSTGFLSWGFLLTYFTITLTQNLIAKKPLPRRQLFILGSLTLVCAAITILPPKVFRDYQLLWKFFTNREFLGNFIVEWGPISRDFSLGFNIYTSYAVLATGLFSYLSWQKKQIIRNLWSLPFFLMILLGYSATRNVPLGMLGSVILIVWSTKQILERKQKIITWTIYTLVAVLLAAHVWLLIAKYQFYAGQRLNYPVAAAQFAKKYLKGRMFNDYNYGGYLVYQVYPQLQIFLDGRAEVFLCCEMRDYLGLAVNKNLPDHEFRQFLATFVQAYQFNFFILTPSKHNVMRRVATLLNTDPEWSLVFWDDYSEVFVRRDGVNDQIIRQLDAKAATPYLRDPFAKDNLEQALYEYKRMDEIVKSARTSNALGYIFLLNSQFDIARERFSEAVGLDPTFESPYMNLGELAARDDNLLSAIKWYDKARYWAPDRGLIYKRLGELIYKQTGDLTQAQKVWSQGVGKTVDTEAKTELQRLLESGP